MPIPLREVLRSPSLAAAEPLVLAGRNRTGRLVRWVHTSEVLEIAALLRGGELLLVGGVGLAPATPEQRQRYVRELAGAQVAGLAIETGPLLERVPPEMVTMAEHHHLPLIELRRVVPFVEVTQEVNGLLAHASVRRLQLADRVSHALANELSRGGDVEDLLRVLAEVTSADARLTSLAGELIGEAVTADRTDPADRPVVVAVASGGVTVAMLSLTMHPGGDALLVDAASDRAPEAIGLALLRSRPLSVLERDTSAYLALAVHDSQRSPAARLLTKRLGLDAKDGFVAVVGRLDQQHAVTSGLDSALRRSGRVSVSQVRNGRFVAVVGLDAPVQQLALSRAALLRDVRASALPPGGQIVVGPATRRLEGVSRCLAASHACLDLVDAAEHDQVVDANDLAVCRFVRDLGSGALVRGLVEEQLGELLAADQRKGSPLFETLATYLRNSGSKTRTAAALHLQRQTLYQRLAKIFHLVGNPEPGTAHYGALLLATELESARRQLQDDR